MHKSFEEWFDTKLIHSVNMKSADKNELSKLTIIVPSYNRQYYILRQCIYWQNSGATLIIVDGSKNSLKKNYITLLENLDNVTYIHSSVNIMKRLKCAAELIKTKYTVMSGDDEFLLKSGLISTINELDNNPELVACMGQSLNFFYNEYKNKTTFSRGYPHYKYKIVDQDIKNRLKLLMSNYTAVTAYAVHKTKLWQKSWGNLKVSYSSNYVHEIQQAMMAVINGKVGTVDEVYWMRSSENNFVDDRTINFQDWWVDDDYKSEQECLVDLLSEELAYNGEVDKIQARNIIIESMNIFVNKNIQMSKKTIYSFMKRSYRQTQLMLKNSINKRHYLRMRKLKYLLKSLFKNDIGVDVSCLEEKYRPTPFLFNKRLALSLNEISQLISDFHKHKSLRSVKI